MMKGISESCMKDSLETIYVIRWGIEATKVMEILEILGMDNINVLGKP